MKRQLLVSIAVFLSFSVYAADNWVTPRTSFGQPDLQGIWTNPTLTPMERPDSQVDQQFLSNDEISALEARVQQNRSTADANIVVAAGRNVGGYNQFWLDSGDTVLSTGQTSIVVDPPTGKAPIGADALATRDYYFDHITDSYEFMTVWDRCITRGIPGSMLPAGYNNAYRIVQTPDAIVIIYEMIHDIRIIPFAKSDYIDDKVRLWMGDSLAHWEEDSLIIETRNFNDRGMIASSMAGGRLKGVPVTHDLNVIERFTRISEDTIIWQVRIDDPTVYTQPFTLSMPLTADNAYDMYEYACHEGNYAVPNILRAGRVSDEEL